MNIIDLIKKQIAIVGIGKEGLATLDFFKKNKINCSIYDITKPSNLNLSKYPNVIKKKFGKDYLNDLKNYEIIFRTPGLPRNHPKLIELERLGKIIYSHTKLFFDLCPGKIIGITGTKGKTTTAFLIYNVLKEKFSKNVFIAGNFGKPSLDILPYLNKNSIVVLELSSFQLQDLEKSPKISVITNITSDHLDNKKKFSPSTHQSLKEYFRAKVNIIRYQTRKDFAVLNPKLKKYLNNLTKARKIYFDVNKYKFILSKIKNPNIIGEHNLENIVCAIEVGKILKLKNSQIIKPINRFRGLEHRLEFAAKIDDVLYVNDSAATNPDATLAGLKSFNQPIHLILGGYDKGLNYKNLIKYIFKADNINTVLIIGQIKEKLFKEFVSQKFKMRNKKLKIIKSKSLREAVLTTKKFSNKNEVVLLSPAAASFDMFENYIDRGKKFKEIVRSLKRRREYGEKK